MPKIFLVFCILSVTTCGVYANDFDTAIANTRESCGGISAELSEFKKMAGINTAVAGVGTAAATGATIFGIKKSSTDKDLEIVLSGIPKNKNQTNISAEKAQQIYNKYIEQYDSVQEAQKALQSQSKTYGNWRTGLLGGATATNVAGAIIAGNNRLDDDLKSRIDKCIISINNLSNAVGQARMDGLDITQATKIIVACDKWKNVDLSVLDKRARGAMISSIIGATTGAIGTATSVMANQDNNKDKTNLNTASNVLAGGTALASGTATVFNATQISAAKKIITVADECEATLQ